MRHHTIFVVAFLITAKGLAQVASIDPHLSIVSYGGLLFPGFTTWYFQYETDPVSTRAEVAGSFGVEYGPFVEIVDALISASVEIAYGQMAARDNSTGYGKAEMVIQRLPIMFWCALETQSDLSPYIRIGSGISKTDFREIYSTSFGPNIRFHNWNFTWGIGGGLRYRLSDAISAAIFVESWRTEDTMLELDSWGYKNGISGPYAVTASGFRFRFYL